MRLCRRLRGGALVAAVVSALAVSGCSYRLASPIATDNADSVTTGSIVQPAGPTSRDGPRAPPEELDLAYARAAASQALAHASKDSSIPWQNPQTGAGGNILPLDVSHSEDGQPCRDFLASYMHGAAQDWLRGAACRAASGSWEVTRLAPLKPS